MSRPQQVGLSYFPFNADFLSDPNMLILLDEHCSIGFVVYMCLVSEIFRIEGYYVRLNERYVRILCAKLSISKEKFYSILQCCVEIGIFDAGLWETEKVLTSEYIQKVYQKAKVRKGQYKPLVVNRKFWLLDEKDTAVYVETEDVTDNCNNNESFCNKNDDICNNNPQSKVKENKVNYSKGKGKSIFENAFATLTHEQKAMIEFYESNNVPISLFEYAVSEAKRLDKPCNYALRIIKDKMENWKFDAQKPKKSSDASYDLEEFEKTAWKVPKIKEDL